MLLENQEVRLYSEKIIQKEEFILEGVEQKIYGIILKFLTENDIN